MTRFVDALAARIAALTPTETVVSTHCFRSLLDGRAAPVTSLGAAVGRPEAEVEAALHALAARGMLAMAEGLVTVVRGLSLPPTPHRLTLERGRTLHVGCAVDAIGIPAALGLSARVASSCHACGGAVSIDLLDGRVERAPAGLLIWAADLDAERSLREHT